MTDSGSINPNAEGPAGAHDSSSAAQALIAIYRRFYDRGWCLGTSSNASVCIQRDPLRVLITASGKDKGDLQEADFVVVDGAGRPTSRRAPRPSDETLVHVALCEHPEVGAVLHTHSVWATILSDLDHSRGGVEISGYEMLKGLDGVNTHDTTVRIEIFDNTQDMAELACRVRTRLADSANPLRFAFLLRLHGLYTWGRDLREAHRHTEILEFLLEVLARRRQSRS